VHETSSPYLKLEHVPTETEFKDNDHTERNSNCGMSTPGIIEEKSLQGYNSSR